MGSSADRDDLDCSVCCGGSSDALCLNCEKELALSFCGSCQYWEGEYIAGGHTVEGRCEIRAYPEIGVTAGVRWVKCDKHKPFPQAKPKPEISPFLQGDFETSAGQRTAEPVIAPGAICELCRHCVSGKNRAGVRIEDRICELGAVSFKHEDIKGENWITCTDYSPISDTEQESEVDSKIAAGSKKSAPFMFALAELQYAGMTIDDIIGIEEDCRSVALGFWLRRRREGPFLFDHEARPLAIAAYYLLWEMVAAEGTDPYSALSEVWKVSLFGEKKHGANNWMNAKPEGMWHYEAALWRHIIESTWEEKAEDSGCYHLAHAVWNALMLLEMEMRGVVNPEWVTGEPEKKGVCAYDAEGRTICPAVAKMETLLNRFAPDWHEKLKEMHGTIEITEV